jgi:hypothetical protein
LWDISDLHEYLQGFIAKDSGFINPCWIKRGASFLLLQVPPVIE